MTGKMTTNLRRIPILALGTAAGIALALIGTPLLASAEPALTNDEVIFVTTLAQGDPARRVAPIVPAPGHTLWDLAQLGHQVADDVRHGAGFSAEEDWFGLHNPTLTVAQVSFFVIKAMRLWAPDFARYYLDCDTTGPVLVCGSAPGTVTPQGVFWPAGAVPVPWSHEGNSPDPNPGIPPFVYRGKCDYVHKCVLTPDGTQVMPYIPTG